MMNNGGAEFTSEQVEQQIDMLARPKRSWSNPSPEERLISDLYQVGAEDHTTLENAWQRLAKRVAVQNQANAAGNAVQRSRSSRKMLPERQERPRNMSREATRERPPHKMLRLLQICAALLVVAALVAGTTIVMNNIRQSHASKTATDVTATPGNITSSTAGLYISTPNGVYREDLTSGNVIWHYATDQQQMAIDPVNVVDNVAIFQVQSATTAKIVGVDSATGKHLWDTKEKDAATNLLASGDVILAIVHKTSEAGISTITAYKARTGSQFWSYQPVLTAGNAPANLYDNETLANGVLYLVYGPQVFALQASSGQILWSKTLPPGFGEEMASKPTVSGNRLYFSDYKKKIGTNVTSVQGWLFAIDTTNGDLIWHVLTKYSREGVVNFAPGPAVIGNVLYVTGSTAIPPNTENLLYAYNTSNGALLQNSLQQEGSIFPAPVALHNLLIYGLPQGSDSKVKLVAFNPAAQTIAWSVPVIFNASAVQGVMKVANDVIYVPAYPRILAYTMTGKLLQTYSTQSPLPRPPNAVWSYSVIA
jgi:outer membrane protein assembly factor BamB